MNLSTEAKVGAITIIGFALLAYMIIRLGDFSFGERGYPLNVMFSQVNGLKEGNVVRFAGVEVGQVDEVKPVTAGVEVRIRINPGVKIPVGSTFAIGTDGLLGEKFVNITPPQTLSSYLEPNAIVRGEDSQNLDQLVNTANKTLLEVQKMVHSLNDVIGDENVKEALKETALNARDITARLDEFSTVLARMAVNNEQDVNGMVRNLRDMSNDLRDVAGRVDKMVAAVDNNGQTASDLREAIGNLKSTSVRVEKIAASLEGVATDPDTAQNIKVTLKNAREVSEKANKMLTKINSISVNGDFETLYNTHDSRYRSDADLRINTSERDFVILGATDIGGKNAADFQFGSGDARLAGRAGVIEGKAGVGADTQLNKQLRLSLDVYDPNDVRVKLRAAYELAPDTFLVGETDGLNRQSDQKDTYVGVQRSF